MLRRLADALDAAADPDQVPRAQPVHEASGFLAAYDELAHQRSYRCTAAHAQRLAGLARATGLAKSAIVRAALADAGLDGSGSAPTPAPAAAARDPPAQIDLVDVIGWAQP